MRRLFVPAALLLALSCSLSAQSNKASLNRIVNATSVYITSESGDQFSPRTDPDDRRLAAELENKFRDWKRFIVATRPEDADLIVAVRSPGAIRARTGIHVGNSDPRTGRPGPINSGTVVGGELGPNDDLLTIYEADGYPSSSILWRSMLKDGLANNMPLFEQFKKDVEKTAAEKSKKKK